MIFTIIISNQVLQQQDVLNYPNGATGDHCSLTLAMKWNGGPNSGEWKVTNAYWINLLAHQKNGTFVAKRTGSTHYYSMINKDDSGKDIEAFWMMEAPRGEADNKLWWGWGYLSNPRNNFCANYNVYWRRDGVGY